MLARSREMGALQAALGRSPAVAILGPRQVGKTTVARALMARWPGPTTIFDLEDPEDLARLAEPKLSLASITGLVVIDEVQRRPELFSVLRVLIDRLESETRYLILGSASPDLLRQSSESLAGRIEYHELGGFALDEVGPAHAARLWLRGGFPRSFLAADDAASATWRRAFVRTFLERDLAQLGVRTPAPTLHRFWTMLAHYHAQTWNAAELSRAFGVAASTVRSYLDVLSAALVVRQVVPWHANISKRQVKAPKVYLADSGLLHSLLGLESMEDLERHPKVGASWEGFAANEVIKHLRARPEECFYWATHAGAELDLLVVRGSRRLGFEIKRTTAPRTTKSMRVAIETLELEHLYVVHAGEQSFPLDDRIDAIALGRLLEDLASL